MTTTTRIVIIDSHIIAQQSDGTSWRTLCKPLLHPKNDSSDLAVFRDTPANRRKALKIVGDDAPMVSAPSDHHVHYTEYPSGIWVWGVYTNGSIPGKAYHDSQCEALAALASAVPSPSETPTESSTPAQAYPLLTMLLSNVDGIKAQWEQEKATIYRERPAYSAQLAGDVAAAKMAVEFSDELVALEVDVKQRVRQCFDPNYSDEVTEFYDALQDDAVPSYRQILQNISGTRCLLSDEQDYRQQRDTAIRA